MYLLQQAVKRAYFSNPMQIRSIFATLFFCQALALSLLSTSVAAQKPGTIITLLWFHLEKEFVLEIDKPTSIAEDTDKYKLLIPTGYKDTVSLSASSECPSKYSFTVKPLTPTGIIQLLIPEELSGAVRATTPLQPKEPEKPFGISAFSGKGSKQYRYFKDRQTIEMNSLASIYEQATSDHDYDATAKYISIHEHALLNEVTDNVFVYPLSGDCNDGPLQPIQTISLQDYLPSISLRELQTSDDELTGPMSELTLSPPETETDRLEKELTKKIQENEDYKPQLTTLLHNVFGEDAYQNYSLEGKPQEITDNAPIYHIIGMPPSGEEYELQYLLIAHWNQNSSLLKKMHHGAQRAKKYPSVPLLQDYDNFWSGKSTHLTVFPLEQGAYPLSIYMSSSPESLDISLKVLRMALIGLQALYEHNIYPADINTDNVHIVSEGDLTLSTEVLYASSPLSNHPPEYEEYSPVPTEVIKQHLEQLMQLFFQLRTGQKLETIYNRESPADVRAQVEIGIAEWRVQPQRSWKEWLTKVDAVHDESELSLITQMASAEPDKATLQALIDACHSESLLCPKQHPLIFRETRSVVTGYYAHQGSITAVCDAPECIKPGAAPSRGKSISEVYTMHCDQCGSAEESYDLCLGSCARKLNIPGFPHNKVFCPKGHAMSLIPSPPPGQSKREFVTCNNESCPRKPNPPDLRNSVHYGCLDCCYQDHLSNHQLQQSNPAGYSLCMDCAAQETLKSSHPKGKHSHSLQPVITQNSNHFCSECKKRNPVQKYRFICANSHCDNNSYNLCADCAAHELGWLGAGPLHPAK